MEKSPITNMIDGLGRRALAEATGASVATVHKWAANGRIPSNWQAFAVDYAQTREGFEYVTAEWMLEQHADDARRGAA